MYDCLEIIWCDYFTAVALPNFPVSFSVCGVVSPQTKLVSFISDVYDSTTDVTTMIFKSFPYKA